MKENFKNIFSVDQTLCLLSDHSERKFVRKLIGFRLQ